MTYASRWLPLLAAAWLLPAAGCVVGGDSGQPVLAVDLYWDENARADRFVGGTCGSADVSWMEWELIDEHGEQIAASDEGGEECQDGYNFTKFGPGNYKLVVHGFDDQDDELWTATCKNLELDRFDVLYRCDIER